MNNTHDTLKEHARRVEQEITALRKMLDARRRERTPKSVLRPAGCAGAKGGAMNEQESGHADNSLDRMFDLYESRISQLESKLQMSQAGLAVKDAANAALREDRGRLTALVARLEEWINYLTENMLRPGGAAETPLREIDALRGRIREAYSMLRPPSFTLLGEIYKPVIRRPELERWEATPEVQRALGEEPKP